MKPKYPNVKVKLTDEDGNAFAILAAVKRAMRKADVPTEEMDAFRAQAMAGDYDNLLRTVMEWVEVE